MPSRRNKTQGEAPAQPLGPRPSITTSRSTPSWSVIAGSHDHHTRPAPNPVPPTLLATSSTGTACTVEPDSALIENLSCRIRSFFTTLFIASPYTYAEHLRSLQLSLEAHLRNHYTSIESDATWERIFGWRPNHNRESTVEELRHVKLSSYNLTPVRYFQGSATVTWLDLGIVPQTQKRNASSATAPVPGRAAPSALPPSRHMQPFAQPPQTPRPALHPATVSSQPSHPGEASGSSTFTGAIAARAPPEDRRHTVGTAPPNVRPSPNCRRRHRPALRLDASLSRDTRPRMNSNSHWADDLNSESEVSISDDDSDDDDDGDDGGDDAGGNLRRGFVRTRLPRYQRVNVGNINDFPALPTAPVAQLGRHNPLSPLPVPTAAAIQSPQPNVDTTTRKQAEEASILLETYSRSTSADEQQNYETIRTALDSVHKIWDRLVRAHGGSYSAAAVGPAPEVCRWGGRTALEPESDHTFRPYSACIICYNAVADTVLMPCHHLVLCLECCNIMGIEERARTWSVLVQEEPRARRPVTIKCPLCRAVVSHRIKIYRG